MDVKNMKEVMDNMNKKSISISPSQKKSLDEFISCMNKNMNNILKYCHKNRIPFDVFYIALLEVVGKLYKDYAKRKVMVNLFNKNNIVPMKKERKTTTQDVPDEIENNLSYIG